MEILVFIAAVGIGYLGRNVWSRLKTPRLPAEERAFSERIKVDPTDGGQLERLRPLVVQVGVLTSQQLEPRITLTTPILAPANAGDNYDDGNEWEVYVVDSLGTIHNEVLRTREPELLARTVKALVMGLDAELVDRDGVLR